MIVADGKLRPCSTRMHGALGKLTLVAYKNVCTPFSEEVLLACNFGVFGYTFSFETTVAFEDCFIPVLGDLAACALGAFLLLQRL
jgi:hypothetical protein